jgi:hypothetical protein
MKKNARHIGCVSSQPQQVLLLKSLLSIAGDRADSGNVWIYSDSGHRDAVVMDLDDGIEAPYPDDIDVDVVIAMSRNVDALEGRQFFLQKPLRSKDIVNLLELLDRHLGQVSVTAEARSPAPATASPATEEVGTGGLDTILAQSRRADVDAVSFSFDEHRACLDVKARKLLLDKEFSFRSAAKSTRFAFSGQKAVSGENAMRVSMADFFYEYTLCSKDGGLLRELDLNASYGIRQWPQFLNASNTRALIKFSAYFSRRKSTIAVAADDLVVNAKQVRAYLNAAHAQGLLVMENCVAEAPAAKAVKADNPRSGAPASLGLFGKIRQKLGL